MSFSIQELQEAYTKLKAYIYYDNTDILLRKKLVEFETNRRKDNILSVFSADSDIYNKRSDSKKLKPSQIVEHKLKVIAEAINNFHTNASFFTKWISQIQVDFYPKSIKDSSVSKNFITNKRVLDEYPTERLTAFIDAPIEIHLITVLWIMRYGKDKDASLSDNCFGNRLLLNKEKEKVVKGSGLFKPYFKQYQNWRDQSVKIAQSILKSNKDVLFLNLDIRDYFHSVRIPVDDLYKKPSKSKIKDAEAPEHNLREIFLHVHIFYTELVAKKYQVPFNFYEEVSKNDKVTHVILPIGLLSSYILANDYLKDFDLRITQKIKPAYYGRYVDDILIVIADPSPDYQKKETREEFKFSFEKYRTSIEANSSKNENESISFSEDKLTEIENYVLHNFLPVIKLVDTPAHLKSSEEKEGAERSFKIAGYPSLYCQSSKSLLYFFDADESDLVIDKLKKQLDEKTSEFRDFPEENENEESFEESAYYLNYDGSDGKIRTLKDYKENRYGLTVYLANKIFSALRHEKNISDEEGEMVLKFFRGVNSLNFYRLWERVFTFFLVNRQPKLYVDFYVHCAQQIEKLTISNRMLNLNSEVIQTTLFNYLDCAHEIALSLNPEFIKFAKKVETNFKYQMRKVKSKLPVFFDLFFEPTSANSWWIRRFRETNMIRHHYVIHPLLSYTIRSKTGALDLTSLKLKIKEYSLDPELLDNSPRQVKFGECSLAIALLDLAGFQSNESKVEDGRLLTNCLGVTPIEKRSGRKITTQTTSFYLDKAFELYKQLNLKHIPEYRFDDTEFKDRFYIRRPSQASYDDVKPVLVQEIEVNAKGKKIMEPKIAFANTEVKEENIIAGLRGTPNLGLDRYQKLAEILKMARKEKSDMLIFPECFIPVNLLSSLVRYAERNQVLTITGLEHISVNNTVFNFIVTILPVELDGIKDSVAVFRLKNHYSHSEEALIEGNHSYVPRPSPFRYDIFNWKNLYFSCYYCFELANSLHRSLMMGKIDLLVGVEWNKDTSYFSNIVEAGSRDLHTYVAQVNTSQFGDSRLTQPVETARKDILRLKGGANDTILVEKINITKLREFQRQKFSLTHEKSEFKPLPPDFKLKDVLNRINNQTVL